MSHLNRLLLGKNTYHLIKNKESDYPPKIKINIIPPAKIKGAG